MNTLRDKGFQQFSLTLTEERIMGPERTWRGKRSSREERNTFVPCGINPGIQV
jgi:hypothetical protein